jgi:hypothetical protein
MFSSVKSVILSGNLNVKNSLKYKLCPNSTEFSQGLWNISIPSISFSCHERNVKEVCQITCNFVKSQRWSKNNEIESYEQPLGMFLLETASKTIYLDKIWFKLHTDTNELHIRISNMNEDLLNLDCFVSVLVLFQKIY